MNIKEAIEQICVVPDVPTDSETGHEYIRRQGIDNFTFAETLQLKRLGVVAPEPPRHWWPRIVPALWFAEALRASVSAEMGREVPHIIGNGFRPSPRNPELPGYKDLNKRVGGASRSTHIGYWALDLDPRRDDKVPIELSRNCAATIAAAVEKRVIIGLGFYRLSNRVHVDIRHRGTFVWGQREVNGTWGGSKNYVVSNRIR